MEEFNRMSAWMPLPEVDIAEDLSDPLIETTDEGHARMRTILNSIYRQHELNLMRRLVLYHKDVPFKQRASFESLQLHDRVTVQEYDGIISWEVDIPETHEAYSSISSRTSRIRKRHERHKTRHDLVAEAITTIGTDVELRSVYPPMDDDDDIITPDIHFHDQNDVNHFIELATSRGSNEKNHYRDYDGKMFKYKHAINNRCIGRSTATLSVIVVTHQYVYSSILLPIDVVNDLVFRMVVAMAVEDKAGELGIDMSGDRELSTEETFTRVIKSSLQKVTFDENADESLLRITTSYISEVTSEPNLELAHARFKENMKSSMKYLIEKGEKQKAMTLESMIKESCNKFAFNRCSDDRTFRRKPVIPIPLLCLDKTPNSTKVEIYGFLVEDERYKPLEKIWNSVMEEVEGHRWGEENFHALLMEAVCTEQKDLDEMEALRNQTKRTYRRVRIKGSLDRKTLFYLQKDGIYAKKDKDNPLLKSIRAEKKKSLHWNVSTRDIENFLSSNTLFNDHGKEEGEDMTVFNDLLERAKTIAGTRLLDTSQVNDLCSTKIFRSLELITAISVELAISMKQNCEYGEFIIKKLRYFDVYLLISPTKLTSHCFFSIFFPGIHSSDDLASGLGPQLIPCFSGCFTEFRSVRVDKLENLAGMASSLISLSSFWSWFYSLDNVSLMTNSQEAAEARRMTLLTILIRLEDKAETEETITLVRYMYMEIFKAIGSLECPDPFKILPKFSEKVRSRLNMYLQKNILESFSKMLLNRPKKRVSIDVNKVAEEGEDSTPGDEWDGLLNCFTQNAISSATQAVNLFYVGYVKNKNEVSQGNSEWGLLEKVLVEELTINDEERGKSFGSVSEADPLGPKQFCRESIKFGCSLMEKRLEQSYGMNWKSIIDEDILRGLAKHRTHSIASLKASAHLDHKKMNEQARVGKNDPVHRVKVIEAIAEEMEKFGLNPMERLSEILTEIENSSNGVVCDLFKKNQHGGLREIYVMTIKSRIVQLYIETLSRVLCSQFEEETLTHPKNKIKLLDHHRYRSARIGAARLCNYSDICSSSDKTRWSQNFVIPALCIPLFRLTCEHHHPLIQRILNLWCGRKIRIPAAVLDLLGTKTPLMSPEYMNLMARFHDPESQKPYDRIISRPMSAYVTLRTGFMQGILHFTSSLLHLSLLHSFKWFAVGTLRSVFPSQKFTMTQVCSSDDSATILSVFGPEGKKTSDQGDMGPIRVAEVILESLNHFCKDFCMKNSVKSTTSLHDYVEFNSEFIFKNTIAIPTIKFVAASLNITESESFIRRFQTMYNLISDLYATGFPSYNTTLCQIGQMLLHYTTMGLTSGPLFKYYSAKLIELPSHAHGFYYLDDEMCPGLMGYSYSVWRAIRGCKALYLYLHTIPDEAMEVNPYGGIMESLSIKMGGLSRWIRMLMRIDPEFRGLISRGSTSDDRVYQKQQELAAKATLSSKLTEAISENPLILFEDPQTMDQLRTKLLILASMPGVSSSMQTGNPFYQALAMSLFSINTHCFTRSSLTASIIDGVVKRTREVSKTSLLLDLTTKITQISKMGFCPNQVCRDSRCLERAFHDKLNSIISLFFPLHLRYEEAMRVSQDSQALNIVPHMRVRYRKNVVVVQPMLSSSPLSLFSVCRKWWFGYKVKSSHRVYQRCRDKYRHIFPWLRETFHETMKESPFSTEMELYNFISTDPARSRQFVRNGPGVYSSVFREQLSQTIIKSYKSGKILVRTHRTTLSSQRSNVVKASAILGIPVAPARVSKMNKFLKEIGRGVSTESLKLMSRRDAVLSFLAHYKYNSPSKGDLMDALNTVGFGSIWSYTREQTLVESGGKKRWMGPGEVLVSCDGLPLKLTLLDEKIKKIVTNNWGKLRLNTGMLSKIYEQLNMIPDNSFMHVGSPVASFSSGAFGPPGTPGTPIYEDKTFDMSVFDLKRIKFVIRYGMMGLYTSIGRGGRDLPILEYKVKPGDISQAADTIEETGMWDAWINVRRLSARQAVFAINHISSLVGDPGRTSEDNYLIAWAKDTLQGRISFKVATTPDQEISASMYADLLEEEPKIIDDDELDELLTGDVGFFGLCKESDNQMLGVFVAESECPGGEEDEGEDDPIERAALSVFDPTNLNSPMATILTNFITDETEHVRPIYRNDTYGYKHLHPMWDSLINLLLMDDPSFFGKLMKGQVPVANSDMAKNIMKICGIEEKSLSRTAMEALMQDDPGSLLTRFINDLTPDCDDTDEEVPE